MNVNENPLIGPPPAEVRLTEPPLVRVVAQIRFPTIASIGLQKFIAPFQESIRNEYPILRPEQVRSVMLGSSVVASPESSIIWRFYNATENCRVSLAPNFLSLDLTRYISRDDFLSRLGFLVKALESHFNPQTVDRLGVRYIDRVVVGDMRTLSTLIRPEVIGTLVTPLAEYAQYAITENVFNLPENFGQIKAIWGLVPPNGTVDPSVVNPIDRPSWLLDLDAYQIKSQLLKSELVLQQTRDFAERLYGIFRWVVTDDFLRHYGGEL